MLTAKRVAKLLRRGEPGRHFDGMGLYLVIESRKSAHWERRYQLHEKEHYLGLGGVKVFSLAEARERNRKISQQLADKIDPLAAKRADRAQRAAQAAREVSFGECAEEFFKTNAETWKHRAHLAQWKASILGRTLGGLGPTPLGGKPVKNDYCRTLRSMPVQNIDTPVVLGVLKPHWHDKPETMSRVRSRIENVLDWAKAAGYRSGDNPAAWDIIGKLLPARSKVSKVKPFEAVHYNDLPGFMVELRKRQGSAAHALTFLILVTARTREVLDAVWPEINLDERVWTVPAERMKAERDHLVPLTDEAIDLLRGLPREDGSDLVFIGPQHGKPLSSSAMMELMKRMKRKEVVHGFRSTFSDWAHERTGHSNHAIEISLAHSVGSEAERAYRRGPMFDKRRKLMEQWADYCLSPPVAAETEATGKTATGKVLPMRGRSA
jgi:integrase